MKHSFGKTSCILVLSAGLLLGCGDSGDDSASRIEGNTSAFDVSDVGMRGMSWIGEATLLGAELDFPETEMELSTRFFTLMAGHRDMSRFNNPPLEFRDGPVDMGLRIQGSVEEQAPGRLVLAIDSIRPNFSAGLGTSSREEMLADVAANGIIIPEVSREDPLMVTLSISRAGEDNSEIAVTSDSDLIRRIVMRDGERTSL